MYAIIDISGEMTFRDGLPNLDDLVGVIGDPSGDLLEVVSFELGMEIVDMWLNEEGKLINLPPNRTATDLVSDILMDGDWIAGNVVLTGPPDADGEVTSLSALAITILRMREVL